MNQQKLPLKIRLSLGSAFLLGLQDGKQDSCPTTIYLLTYYKGKCIANCSFCSQSRSSKGRADMLSRITWPLYPTKEVISRIVKMRQKDLVKRICVQVLNYPDLSYHLLNLVREIKSRVDLPISISCQPLNLKLMKTLAEYGVDRISIPLDASTKKVFNAIKGSLIGGPYDWDKQRDALREAVKIFGDGYVSTHLIVGLGETEKEIVQTIQWCVNQKIYPGLFAFTPIPGTILENKTQPSILSYRRIQIAHYLITKRKTSLEKMMFDIENNIMSFGVTKEKLRNSVKSGKPFITSGCPDCNRPYYNEKPGGPLYNYPRKLAIKEINEIEQQLY
jgi:biotin synthase